MTLTIALASDHGGFRLKKYLHEHFKSVPVEWVDLGTDSDASVDYPDYARKLADVIAAKKADFGVAVCGTGNGIAMALNRYPHIRAALCHDSTTARLARDHNDANVLVLGGRIVGDEVALDCLYTFLTQSFSNGERHVRRIEKLKNC